MNTLLIFDMQLINGELFLNAKDLFLKSLLFLSSMIIAPLTTIYASL